MAPLDSIVDACKDNDTAELHLVSYVSNRCYQMADTYDDDIPIERSRSQFMRRLREEVHDEAQSHEEDRDNINWQSPPTQAPAAWKQCFATETLEDDTADRDNVRAEERTGAERGDDVQRDFAAQVDEREKHAEDVGRSN